MPDRALIYGINNYESVSDLRGCANDVDNISELLQDEFGFKAKNLRTRKDSEVVFDNLQKDWKWLIEDAQPGDRLVFHFSGHGSHVADDDGDEEDGVDEILCLHDMDFDEPISYLKDDTIHEWTRKLPRGVKLTFLLDCCHSGTGTRALDIGVRSGDQVDGMKVARVITDVTEERRGLSEVKRALTRTRSRSAGERGEDAQSPGVVLARYIEPPRAVGKLLDKYGTRSSLRESKQEEHTNHVRFSGCMDSQTSADAYIDGKHQGAFSHFFCKLIREAGGDINHDSLIEDVRDALRGSSFSQTPQLNPKDLATNVFEGLRSTDGSDAGDEPPSSIASDVSPTVLRQMERIESKLDDLIDAINEMGTRQGRRRRRRRKSRIEDRAKQSIVYVHGICLHEEGYSDDWFEALRPHLDRSVGNQLARNHHEVLWSKHVSTKERSSRSDKEQKLADELADVLCDRAEQAMELQMSPARSGATESSLESRDLERALLGIPGLDCVDDFIKYLLNKTTRRKVMNEFDDVVRPLLENGHEIHVISHSWGTVVALEALHDMDDKYEGKVKNLFTVGSALSIRTVQRQLKFGARNGEKPGIVEKWINLDARGDVVGGTLRAFSSDVDAEFLNLEPTGCSQGFFGPSPACAHSSYFDERNTTVNREIFARQIS